MNSKAERLLEDYRQADFTKRLHLFLEYPELRIEFMQIDQDTVASRQCALQPSDAPATRSVARWLRFPLLPGFPKGCCR